MNNSYNLKLKKKIINKNIIKSKISIWWAKKNQKALMWFTPQARPAGYSQKSFTLKTTLIFQVMNKQF